MGQLELTRAENELLLQLLEHVPLSGTAEALRATLLMLDVIRDKLVRAELELPPADAEPESNSLMKRFIRQIILLQQNLYQSPSNRPGPNT